MISWYAVLTRPQAESTALQSAAARLRGVLAAVPGSGQPRAGANRAPAAVPAPSVCRPRPGGKIMAANPLYFRRCRPGAVGDEPAIVPENIIRSLREREEAGAFDRISPHQSLRIGDLVRVTEVLLKTYRPVVELRDQHRSRLLHLFCMRVRAHLGAVAVAAA